MPWFVSQNPCCQWTWKMITTDWARSTAAATGVNRPAARHRPATSSSRIDTAVNRPTGRKPIAATAPCQPSMPGPFHHPNAFWAP